MMRPSFDALTARFAMSPTTLGERELLELSHWSLGEDARLREDERFRETLWGRWMLAEDFLANDAIYRWLHAERRSSTTLKAALSRASDLFGRRSVFCPGDPRFVLRRDEIHLTASELSRQPVLEHEVGDLEKYTTHLPLHSLKAAAASEPAGQWGPRAQEQTIETLGWVRVTLPGRRLNDRMFIAAIEGHSMDDGKSGLVDGGYAVFELWPSGSKQHLSVLVRGSFHDPETGSYAVKKYITDERDEEGMHHKISLVSLNPDKQHYPDIELVAEDDTAVAVVAKVVQALSTDDYERRPKIKRHAGRRILSGPEGLDEQTTRLGRRVATFFDGAAPDDDYDTPAATSSGWQARLVCLGIDAGALHLEVGPLAGLPPFAKKLRVVGETGWDSFVLAANVRTRPTRVPARPGTGPWRWEAVGFEDERDLGMDRLTHEALSPKEPTVFLVGADGVGQRLTSTRLALGQAYHLLLPPEVGEASLGAALDDGWRIWSIDLAAPESATTRQALKSLGLDVGEASPRLGWGLFPAAAWRTNGRGESYPVFDLGVEVLVSVGGVSVDEGDTVMLFLHGPTGTERIQIYGNGIVSLGVLPLGRWACALLHSRTSVQPATMMFEVTKNATEHVSASWKVTAPGGLSSLEVTAPPGWPVTLRWQVLHEEPIATLHTDDNGTVQLEGVNERIEARARRTRVANLVIDLGELGRSDIAHEGRATVQQVRESLTVLWQQRSSLVKSRAGAWLQLMPTWFEPVTVLFGYGLEALTMPTYAALPHDLAAWRLTVDERIVGSIMRSTSRVLVLTTDIAAVLQDQRAWIDEACSEAKVREAIVTDGARWTTHRKGSQQLKQQVWNLDHAIGLGSVDDMLGALADGL
jgi:hypothetical protein